MKENNGESMWTIDVYFKDDVVIENLYVNPFQIDFLSCAYILVLFSSFFFPFKATLSWNYKTANDMKFKPFLGIANLSMDLCSYLVNGNSMLVNMFLEDFKRHSNLIHPCPFKVLSNPTKIHILINHAYNFFLHCLHVL